MNSISGVIAPWALRIWLVVILLCISVLAGIAYSWLKIPPLKNIQTQTHSKLLVHQRAERDIKEKLRRQNNLTQTAPDVMKLLFPLGHVLTEDIAILRLDAQFNKESVCLEVAGRSLPALLDFISRVQKTPLQIELQNHRFEKEQAQEWPIRATMDIHLSTEVTPG